MLAHHVAAHMIGASMSLLYTSRCGIRQIPARPSCQISAKTPTSFHSLNGHPSVWYSGNSAGRSTVFPVKCLQGVIQVPAHRDPFSTDGHYVTFGRNSQPFKQVPSTLWTSILLLGALARPPSRRRPRLESDARAAYNSKVTTIQTCTGHARLSGSEI